MTLRNRFLRSVVGVSAVAALALATAACGDDSGDAEPNPPADSTTTAVPSTTTSSTTTAPPDGPEGAAATAVVDQYIEQIAAGDLDAAWELVDERSRAALGGFAEFESLRSALSEGIGVWSVAESALTTVVPLAPDAAAVVLRGVVAQEGPPAPATTAVVVRGTGDDVRVSPFEEVFANDAAVEFDPPRSAEVAPGDRIAVSVPADVEVTIALDQQAPTSPSPASEQDGTSTYEVTVPSEARRNRHVVAVALADAAGDRRAISAMWTAGEGGSAESVAKSFVDAWRAGDRAGLEALAEPQAVQQAVDAQAQAGREWAFERCEGAAGSVYCTWSAEGDELVVRVANVTEQRVVTEVRIGTP